MYALVVTGTDRIYGGRRYRTPATLGRDEARQARRRQRDGEGDVSLTRVRLLGEGQAAVMTGRELDEATQAFVEEWYK